MPGATQERVRGRGFEPRPMDAALNPGGAHHQRERHAPAFHSPRDARCANLRRHTRPPRSRRPKCLDPHRNAPYSRSRCSLPSTLSQPFPFRPAPPSPVASPPTVSSGGWPHQRAGFATPPVATARWAPPAQPAVTWGAPPSSFPDGFPPPPAYPPPIFQASALLPFPPPPPYSPPPMPPLALQVPDLAACPPPVHVGRRHLATHQLLSNHF